MIDLVVLAKTNYSCQWFDINHKQDRHTRLRMSHIPVPDDHLAVFRSVNTKFTMCAPSLNLPKKAMDEKS
jgi:hypothetical protein